VSSKRTQSILLFTIHKKLTGKHLKPKLFTKVNETRLTNVPEDFGEVIKSITDFLGPVAKTQAAKNPSKQPGKS